MLYQWTSNVGKGVYFQLVSPVEVGGNTVCVCTTLIIECLYGSLIYHFLLFFQSIVNCGTEI